MKTMDWQERIVTDPKILVGKPVFKGTRLAVEFIVDLLAMPDGVAFRNLSETFGPPGVEASAGCL